MVKVFEGAARHVRYVLGFTAISVLFWLAQFVYQFYFLSPGDVLASLVRSFSLSGATFIGLALFTSALLRWIPGGMRHIRLRRSFGVLGFTFIILHVAFVLILNSDIGALIFQPLNPLENPVIFGTMAFPIFFALWATSTDWAVEKMGFRKWKALHRLVYLAYLFSVLHFITVNPPAIMNIPGYALLAVTFLALAGELFWFVKMRWQMRFSGIGTFVGLALIFVWLLVIYFALVAPLFS